MKKKAIAAPKTLSFSARYRRFIETDEGGPYNGRYVAGLPNWSVYAKFKVNFLKKPDFTLFEDKEIDRKEWPGMVPLSPLGDEPEFLAVDASHEDCPVFHWEHETGKFEEVAPSLDAFLATLFNKGEKLPIQRLKESIKQANAAYKAKKYDEILKALSPALTNFPEKTRPVASEADDEVGNAFNLWGLAFSNLKRTKEAVKAFQRAVEFGDEAAILNLMAIYLEDLNDVNAAIALGKDAVFFQGDEHVFWVERYLVEAYLRKGKRSAAEEELRAMHGKFAVIDVKKIVETRTWLEEFSKKKSQGAAIAKDFLEWFKPISAASTSTSAQASLRQWWNDLPKYGTCWQPFFRGELKLKGKKEPTDDQLARMMAIETVKIEEKNGVIDVTPLARLKRLDTLMITGEVLTLEPLRGLSKSMTVDVNGETLRDLRLPKRANLALLAAAEAGDLKAVVRALDDGADPNAKDSSIDSALHLLKRTPDKVQLQIAKVLIDRGAHLYVDDSDDKTPLEDLAPKMVKKLEEIYKKSGKSPAKSPFRVWTKPDNENWEGDIAYIEPLSGLKELPPGKEAKKAKLVASMEDFKGKNRLVDFHEPVSYDHVGAAIVSARLKDFLTVQGWTKGVSFLPIQIQDQKKKRVEAKYFLLNAIQYDCIDEAKSEPVYSWDEDFSEVRRLVIHESRVPRDVQIFRVRHYAKPLMIRAGIESALAAAKFELFRFIPPRR